MLVSNMQNFPQLGYGDLHKAWTKWRKRFTDYLSAAGKDKDSNRTKLSILRHCMGDRGRAILEMLFPAEVPLEDAEGRGVREGVRDRFKGDGEAVRL